MLNLDILVLVSLLLVIVSVLILTSVFMLHPKTNIKKEIENNYTDKHFIKIYIKFCSSLINKKFDCLNNLCHDSFLKNLNLIGNVKPNKLEYYELVKSEDNLSVFEIYSRDCNNCIIGDRVYFKKINNSFKILQVEGIK